MMLRAEPTKQKTRRPERRGITQAVSPKKIGKRKKGNVLAQKLCGERGAGERSTRFGVEPDPAFA
jgi:hypothetical protein